MFNEITNNISSTFPTNHLLLQLNKPHHTLMPLKEGDQLWIKMPTYPWWPAKVISPSDERVTDEVKEQSEGKDTLVIFYGSNDLFVEFINFDLS